MAAAPEMISGAAAVFNDHDRSASVVGRIAARARKHVEERRPRYEVDPAERRDLTARFLTAATDGDIDGLMAMLAPDVRLVGDSGGKSKAPFLPL